MELMVTEKKILKVFYQNKSMETLYSRGKDLCRGPLDIAAYQIYTEGKKFSNYLLWGFP